MKPKYFTLWQAFRYRSTTHQLFELLFPGIYSSSEVNAVCLNSAQLSLHLPHFSAPTGPHWLPAGGRGRHTVGSGANADSLHSGSIPKHSMKGTFSNASPVQRMITCTCASVGYVLYPLNFKITNPYLCILKPLISFLFIYYDFSKDNYFYLEISSLKWRSLGMSWACDHHVLSQGGLSGGVPCGHRLWSLSSWMLSNWWCFLTNIFRARPLPLCRISHC